ncbi:hypothetical protein [Tabrizicola sp.]|uniref:hypothetical protein n=1 Tax=Tabrizicola sp. TaxID=2005166 RepID=UPI0035ADB589
MGHIHLGVLPKTKKWREVVGAIIEGSPDRQIVAASARAAENDLLSAANDPVFVEAVRLLLSIPLAARASDFGDGLRNLDLQVGASPGLFEIVAASMARLDEVARESIRSTDLGELAARSFAQTLNESISADLPGLFEATPEDVQAVIRRLSYSKGIAAFSRAYFGNLVAASLSYWLDRTLSLQVGPDRRFESVSRRTEFDVALRQYTSEATRIIQEFAGGWYGKTLHEAGRFGAHEAQIFGAVALRKITEGLRVRWVDDV